MAALDERHVLLTVGDQGFNGVDFATDHVQDPNASYGKTVIVDLADGSWEPYTIGHRNPQGLWVDSAGVWLTEHGPQGGDELNRLRRGEHYGWPLVTYGTDYGRETWPLNVRQGRHEGFAKPVYSWLPSIGASNLIVVQGTLFEGWRGDLLIGSLVSEALWRVRVEADRVALVERIDLGERVRDIVEDPSGRILLLTDSYSILQLSPTTHVYAVCASCHGPVDGSAARLGPPLNGVVGRPVASVTEFPYSDALRSLEGAWTAERLHLFLQDPQAFAPGTTMRMHGIGDEQTRARIIEYLSNSEQ
jgi:cytochrome c2